MESGLLECARPDEYQYHLSIPTSTAVCSRLDVSYLAVVGNGCSRQSHYLPGAHSLNGLCQRRAASSDGITLPLDARSHRPYGTRPCRRKDQVEPVLGSLRYLSRRRVNFLVHQLYHPGVMDLSLSMGLCKNHQAMSQAVGMLRL